MNIQMIKYRFKQVNSEIFLGILFQILVFSSFWGTSLLPISVPGIGELYLFRVALFIFVCFYIIDSIRKKKRLIRGRTKIEYAVLILACVMILYGILSLVRAIDFIFTFKRLFNLSIDLLFFIAIIFYIDDSRKIKFTMFNCIINIVLLQFIGVFETFYGNLFTNRYDNYSWVRFFNRFLKPPVVSFGNTNDYITMLLFFMPFLIFFLAYQIYCSKSKISRAIYSNVILIIISFNYYLTKASEGRIAQFIMNLFIVGFSILIILKLRKLTKILFVYLFLVLLIIISNNYVNLHAKTLNYINTVKYEKKLARLEKQYDKDTNSLKESLEQNQKPDPIKVPERPKMSLRDQFFTYDEETNDTELNVNSSGGVRLALLKFAGTTLFNSKGLGVGLGNTEQKAKDIANENLGGIWAIHCFPARIAADMGIFIIIPVGVLMVLLLKELIKLIRLKRKPLHINMIITVVIISIISFPFLSTVPSDAQDLLGMWFCVAWIIIGIIRYKDSNNLENSNDSMIK